MSQHVVLIVMCCFQHFGPKYDSCLYACLAANLGECIGFWEETI